MVAQIINRCEYVKKHKLVNDYALNVLFENAGYEKVYGEDKYKYIGPIRPIFDDDLIDHFFYLAGYTKSGNIYYRT